MSDSKNCDTTAPRRIPPENTPVMQGEWIAFSSGRLNEYGKLICYRRETEKNQPVKIIMGLESCIELEARHG
jgi:hypothetical protein